MTRAIAALLLVAAAASAGPAEVTPLPNPEFTPGVVRNLSTEKICTIRWGRDRRHVTSGMKREVFESYGCTGNNTACCTPDRHGRACEIDHLISRELGGADDVKNLWPQSYGGPWNAVMKDRLENRLHKEVCSGRLGIRRAQRWIVEDWRDAYRHYFGEP